MSMLRKYTTNDKRSCLFTLFFAVQPCLDVLAYWTRNDSVTPAGIIRLLLLVVLPIVTLIITKQRKSFLLFLFGTGCYCLLHILNCARVGYLNPVFDIRYLVSVVQMPVFAVCFVHLIRNEQCRKAAVRGVWVAAALTALFLILARLTNTGNVTYGEGLGYSGWVIDDNRNANSTLLVLYACFCIYYSFTTDSRLLKYAVPVLIVLVFLSNGTKGCFYSIFAILLSFSAFLLFEALYLKKELNKRTLVLFLALCLVSVLIYPWTPRYKVTESQRNTAKGTQGEIEATLLQKGIDITDMSPQQRFDDPEVKEVFEHYYWKYLGEKPDLIDRFGMDRVLMQYQMTTDVAKLIDARIMERNYADMIFQDSDTLTRFVGIEVSEMGYDGVYDLENDWHALFYYYGYLGFALYVGFVLYMILGYLKKCRRSFKTFVCTEAFTYLVALLLNLGLAHFSGASLRRPNVSFMLSLILALLFLFKESDPDESQSDHSGI